MGRAPCCDKVGVKKGRWTAEEDDILTKYIQSHGEGSWRSLPKNAGLVRCGKSCRLRWINYLRADLKRGNISREEEDTIIKLHSTLGNRWSLIAAQLPGRTDNEIKNYWNSHLSRTIYAFRRHVIKEPAQPHPPSVDIGLTRPTASSKPRRGKTSRWAMKKNKTPSSTKTQIKENPSSGDSNRETAAPSPGKEALSSDHHHRTLVENKERDAENVAMSSPNHQKEGTFSGIDDFGMLLYFNDTVDHQPNDPDPNPDPRPDPNGAGSTSSDQWLSSSSPLDRDIGDDWKFHDYDQLWRDMADDNLMSHWLPEINRCDINESGHDSCGRVEIGESEIDHEKQNAMVAWLFS